MILFQYSASDKYDIPGLREQCEAMLIGGLSTENAAELYLKAYLHGGSNLKEASTTFIFKNIQQIKQTPGWIELRKNHNALEEIIEFMSSKMP